MRKVLLLMVVAVVAVLAASISGTANAATGTPGAASTPSTSVGFIPDPGVTTTTDPSKAPAGKALIATPSARAISPHVACATCGGGGDVQGCATVYVNNGDGYGNWVKAYYHWCWLNGSISSNYGWGDEAACWGFCNFEGWNYNFDFSYGHQDKGTFRDVSGGVFHVDSADTACVAVDGWGNAWGC